MNFYVFISLLLVLFAFGSMLLSRLTLKQAAKSLRPIAKSQATLYLIVLVSFFINSCKYNPKEWQEKKLVVTTTGMLGDAIREILPNNYQVYHLMGAGVDPHSYEAKPTDIQQLAKAETIVFNGLHLEGKMVELFEKLGKEKMVYAFSDGLDHAKIIDAGPGSHDPHIWLDPFLWADGVENLGKQLAKNYPEDKNEILKNAKRYAAEIRDIGNWMRNEIEQIPKNQRVLITSHDAFSYFGRQFSVEVDALQGISTVSEPGIRTVSNLTKKIIRRKIAAVFIESSVSSKSIQALKEACARKNYVLKEGGTLYSDAMGDASAGAETYLKMLQRNTETLVKGLKSSSHE